MSDGKTPAPVTRRELYPIIASIYLLIALALLGVIRDEGMNLHAVGYFLLVMTALGMSLTFTFFGIRERRR